MSRILTGRGRWVVFGVALLLVGTVEVGIVSGAPRWITLVWPPICLLWVWCWLMAMRAAKGWESLYDKDSALLRSRLVVEVTQETTASRVFPGYPVRQTSRVMDINLRAANTLAQLGGMDNQLIAINSVDKLTVVRLVPEGEHDAA